jgi:hypothetical protein
VSRGLTYWNDETIKLIRERFVAVAVPTWVARADGPEGEFLRGAGIDKKWVTSSGYMNCVSASGNMLGGRPSAEVLSEFEKLPEAERRAGVVAVADLDSAQALIPVPPRNGLVLKVHARFLSEGGDGKTRYAKVADFPLMRTKPNVMRTWKLFLEPNTEYLWLTEGDWRALVPERPVAGQRVAVDPVIAMRMARFHLNPKRATTSEGGIVSEKQVKTAQVELVVDQVSAETITIRLTGAVHWGSEFDAALATSPGGPLGLGFSTSLHGRLEFDRPKGAFVRFDMVAPGHVWGRWGDANGKSMYVERPGKTPFGFSFELASGASPTERIPPGGNGRSVSERSGYFRAGSK